MEQEQKLISIKLSILSIKEKISELENALENNLTNLHSSDVNNLITIELILKEIEIYKK